MTPPRFRRPAALDPQEAENLEGAADLAESSQTAHETAQLLLGTAADSDAATVARLVDIIAADGIEIVSELWANQPATTLPGTLWRLYLIGQWAKRDPQQLRRRYDEGLAAPEIPGVPAGARVDLDQTIAAIEALLAGRCPHPLWQLLGRVAVLLRILAAGVTYGPDWIKSDSDQLAHPVTRRSAALTRTATEIAAAAARARADKLD